MGGVLLCVLSASCQEPTELTLVLSTNAQCGTQLTSTAIYVGSSPDVTNGRLKTSSPSPDAFTKTCNAGDIGTLVVTPGAMHGAVVVAAGFGGKSAAECFQDNFVNCIVARRTFSFVKHTPLTIPVELELDCLNVPCDQNSTCHNGSCYSASVDCSSNGSCTNPGDGDAGPVDGGPKLQPDGAPEPVDSSVVDGAHVSPDGSIAPGTDGGREGGVADAGVDSGTDAGRIATNADAGVLVCTSNGAGVLQVSGCGGGPLCNSTQACCASVPNVFACDSVASCGGFTPVYCCENSQCVSGKCCAGVPVISPARGPSRFAPGCAGTPIAGGPPGTCL
jgi:hypothetical protein